MIETWKYVEYYDHYTYWNPAGTEQILTVPLTVFEGLFRSDRRPAAWLLYRKANGFFKVLELKDGTQYLYCGFVKVREAVSDIADRDEYKYFHVQERLVIEEKTLSENNLPENIPYRIFNPEDLREIKRELGILYDEKCCREFEDYLRDMEKKTGEIRAFSAVVPDEILRQCQGNDICGTYGKGVWFLWHEADASFHIFGQGNILAGLECGGEYFNTLCMFLCNCGIVEKVILEPGITRVKSLDVFGFPDAFFDVDDYELDQLILPEGLEALPDLGSTRIKKLKLPHSIKRISPLDELVISTGGHWDPVTYQVQHLILPSDIQLGLTFTLYEPAEYLKTIEFYGDEPVKDPEMLCEAGLFCNGNDGSFNAVICYPGEWDAAAGGMEKGFAGKVVEYLRTRKNGWPRSYWCYGEEDDECWEEEDYQTVPRIFQWSVRKEKDSSRKNSLSLRSYYGMLQELEAEEHLFGREFLEALQIGKEENINAPILTLDEYPPLIVEAQLEYSYYENVPWIIRFEKTYLTMIEYSFWLYRSFRQQNISASEQWQADEFVYRMSFGVTLAKIRFDMAHTTWKENVPAYLSALIQAAKAEYTGLSDGDFCQAESVIVCPEELNYRVVSDESLLKDLHGAGYMKTPGILYALRHMIEKQPPEQKAVLLAQLDELVNMIRSQIGQYDHGHWDIHEARREYLQFWPSEIDFEKARTQMSQGDGSQ